MNAPAEIVQLVERFDRNAESYRSVHYNETQLRREFLDPFLEALGWDVNNRAGYAEPYKDVIHEDAIKIGGGTKAPDYCIRIGGTRKFFLEAKRPAVNIKEGVNPAFQLRRYAWSSKLPLSILTDFEEFAVYDCRIAPVKTDKSSTARTMYLNYKDYIDKWDSIHNVFSRESVLRGSFDKYAASSKVKKGTAEVDDAFLKEIESWRLELARSLALRNSRLTTRELNFAVQRTIDRLIFLRICEDRGIEEYGRLMALENGSKTYGRLLELFHRADEKYNSGLFYFQAEESRAEGPDTLTPSLDIDDKPLKEIIRNLYYPDSPYEFSVLPADILGQVYEQFLGHVIRLTAAHHAKVEPKPEVKKAGGVYYTPRYIVDYIVKKTVGKLLAGKTTRQAGRLRILDPACGSGSFLIGAYQYVLDWHLDRYIEDGPDKHRRELYTGPAGDWRLTTAEKRRILLSNIYGVDIDPQAVEVTKLSLLLKLLEGESEQTLASQYRLFHERALPDIGTNIKCGNSLIGPDFHENQMTLLGDDERYRVNIFDWQAEFEGVMKSGGFDAVIGNPPYIGFLGFTRDKEYFKRSFISARGRFDYYLPFIEKGLDLLRDNGLLGFICPTNFTKRGHGQALRGYLKNNVKILEVCDFVDVQIFVGALNYTGVFFLEKAEPLAAHNVLYKQRSLEDPGFSIRQAGLGDESWVFRSESANRIVEKVQSQSVSCLSEMAAGISEGIVTGRNDVKFKLDLKEMCTRATCDSAITLWAI